MLFWMPLSTLTVWNRSSSSPSINITDGHSSRSLSLCGSAFVSSKGEIDIFSELFSRYQLKEILRWALYSVLFLVSMLLQTIVLPQIKLSGITLCVVPICTACVAVREGAERGTLFAILTGVFFCLSGVSEGPIYIVLLAVTAALAGTICDNFYTRSFFPALVLSLMSLTICEVLVFLFRVNTTDTAAALWHTVLLPEILLSLLAFPLIYLGAWAISRIAR